jgi:hypothetical protein
MVVLRPGIVVMRLPLKTVKSEDLVLPVIGSMIYMDTDTLIILEPAVLDPKPEHTGRDVGRLCGVSIIAWWLHQVSLASVVHTLVMESGTVGVPYGGYV